LNAKVSAAPWPQQMPKQRMDEKSKSAIYEKSFPIGKTIPMDFTRVEGFAMKYWIRFFEQCIVYFSLPVSAAIELVETADAQIGRMNIPQNNNSIKSTSMAEDFASKGI
jgi:hypothetical protein